MILSLEPGLYKPSPPVDPVNGAFTYVQEWTDLANDGGRNDNTVSIYAGSAMRSSLSAAAGFRHSGRSVESITGPFTIVLEGRFSMNAAIGLNIEGASPTYPDPVRYKRDVHAYTTQTVATNAQQSRPFELGAVMGGAPAVHTWLSSGSACQIAIADTGTQIRYGVSANGGATWTLKYTSLAVYVPGQSFRISAYTLFGDQVVMVRKYPTALF